MTKTNNKSMIYIFFNSTGTKFVPAGHGVSQKEK